MTTAVKPMYDELMANIENIDVKLDSLDDSSSAGKRKIANDLVEAHKDTWEPAAQQIIAQLSNLEGETLVGVFRGIRSELDKSFDEVTKKTVEELVENAPKQEPLITPEEAEELSKLRSELYQSVKMAVKLAQTMDGEELPMPKMRRGSRGKRGPRAMSLMTFYINGEEVDEELKYKEVAQLVGFEKGAELTAYLKSKGVNTTEPENGEFSVELPDGRTFSGEILEDEDEDGDDDD